LGYWVKITQNRIKDVHYGLLTFKQIYRSKNKVNNHGKKGVKNKIYSWCDA
jgi:hypothetical protein